MNSTRSTPDLRGSNQEAQSQLQTTTTPVKTTVAPPYTWKSVGPLTFNFILPKESDNQVNADQIRLALLGCQGKFDAKKQSQKKVADLLQEIIKRRPDLAPHLVIGLGDNFYNDGVKSELDPKWKTNWLDPYEELNLKFAMVFGNHDLQKMLYTKLKADIYKKVIWSSPQESDDEALNPQTNYMYGKHEGDPELPVDVIEFLKSRDLPVELLPKWFLPFPFYSACIEGLQIFFLNSNSYAKDYDELLKKSTVEAEINSADYWFELYKTERKKTEKTPELDQYYKNYIEACIKTNRIPNQAVWFEKEMEQCIQAGRTPMIAQHHAFGCKGKRAYQRGVDTRYYLNDEQIPELRDFIHKEEVEDLKKQLLEKQDFLTSLTQQQTAAAVELSDQELTLRDKRAASFNSIGSFPAILFSDRSHAVKKEKEKNEIVIERLKDKIELSKTAINALDIEINKTKAELKKIEERITKLGEFPLYNELLASILMHQHLPQSKQRIFSLIPFAAAAHDHDIYVMQAKLTDPTTGKIHTIGQLVSGGGGGDIHHQDYFGDYMMEDHVFLDEYGVSIMTCDKKNPKKFIVDIYTVPAPNAKPGQWYNHHIKLACEDGNWKVVRTPSQDERIEHLRKLILKGCGNYQRFLHKRQESQKDAQFSFINPLSNQTHTTASLRQMYDIVNYLQQPELPDYDIFIKEINELIQNISNKTSMHSLYAQINLSIANADEEIGNLVRSIQDNCKAVIKEANKQKNYLQGISVGGVSLEFRPFWQNSDAEELAAKNILQNIYSLFTRNLDTMYSGGKNGPSIEEVAMKIKTVIENSKIPTSGLLYSSLNKKLTPYTAKSKIVTLNPTTDSLLIHSSSTANVTTTSHSSNVSEAYSPLPFFNDRTKIGLVGTPSIVREHTQSMKKQ